MIFKAISGLQYYFHTSRVFFRADILFLILGLKIKSINCSGLGSGSYFFFLRRLFLQKGQKYATLPLATILVPEPYFCAFGNIAVQMLQKLM